MLVVSHDLDLIKESCDRAIWLHKGHLEFDGLSAEAIRLYLESVNRSDSVAF
jgi:ABC-type polysaccharide/polyol phosphate transport system ATPase subunit